MSDDMALEPAGIDKQRILDYLGLDPDLIEVQALLLIAERYALDPVIGHLVMIEPTRQGDKAKPYVTRDGLLHVAHRSGQLDGIEVLDTGHDDTHWWASVAVYRRDMTHPFRYVGRFPIKQHFRNGGSREHPYGQEMAIKTAESHALRRAFDITGVGSVEERWDDGMIEPEPGLGRDNLAELHTRVNALPDDLRERVRVDIRATGATSNRVTLEQAPQVFEILEDAEAVAAERGSDVVDAALQPEGDDGPLDLLGIEDDK